jgi:hypothetical protein
MNRFSIIPKREYVNTVTGQKASIFGASPYGDNWIIQTCGVTLKDAKTGTYSSRHDDTEETISERMDKLRPQWRTEQI